MILYLFYNADLIADVKKDEAKIAYVDDVNFYAEAHTFHEAYDKLHNMMAREGGGQDWSRCHNSWFEALKLTLVGFLRRRSPDPTWRGRQRVEPRPNFVLGGTIIKPAPFHKFLGVLFNQELRWREQAERMVAKATKWSLCARWLARHATGISPRQMRQLYQAVVVPGFSYAADVWFGPVLRPESGGKAKGSVGVARKLTSVQQIATTTVTRALHTLATDVMEVHAYLWPVELMLHRRCHRATLWLAALPDMHPLYKPLWVAACRDIKRYRLTLHQLLHVYGINPNDYKTISVDNRAPNRWSGPQTQIAGSWEESREDDLRDDAELCAYADGSGMDGKAGAAAVLYWRGCEVKLLRYCLGSLERYTTYEAEIVGVILALHLIQGNSEAETVSVKLDNQAVVWALSGCKASPAQALLDIVHGLCNEWHRADRQRRKRVYISWVTGHDGVVGNERADTEAKHAVKDGSSPEDELPGKLCQGELPRSLAAARAAFKDEILKCWRVVWAGSPRQRRISKIDPKLPSYSFMHATDSLTRAQVSVLMQSRTGHAPLNGFLQRIGKVSSLLCGLCPACSKA